MGLAMGLVLGLVLGLVVHYDTYPSTNSMVHVQYWLLQFDTCNAN
jgi:hypothetical protein